MKPIQTACFCLIASAFVLSAILIVRIDDQTLPNAANADGQVIAQPAFTMMTARTRGGGNGPAEESLFVLDNNSGVLVVYAPNVGKKQIEPLAGIRMSNIFGR